MKRFILPAIILMAALTAAAASCWTGKNIALLGDSMTWIGGDSCTEARGWSSHFSRNVAPAHIAVYARSGATWTNAPATRLDTAAYYDVLHDDNVVYTQALRLLADADAGRSPEPDLVVLYAGANDAWFAQRRPGIFTPGARSADGSLPVSLAGSIEATCRLISRALPRAAIVLIAPAQMDKAPADRLQRVAETIDSVGAALGIPVIRTDTDGPIHARQERRPPRQLTTDGIHTNPEGAARLAAYFESELEALCR